MGTIRKASVEDDSSLFGRLPNEIVLKVLTSLIDLKTLCFCKLVYRRFYWIVVEVDNISFTPSLKDNSEATFPKKLLKLMISGFKFNPFRLFHNVVAPASEPLSVAPSSYHKWLLSAMNSLESFKKLKSLRMVLPDSFNSAYNGLQFKWKLSFHDRVDSFMFLSPDSVCYTNGIYDGNDPEDGGGQEEEEEYMHMITYKSDIALRCLKDAIMRYGMLLGCTYEFPLLENVSIADNGKRGRITLSNEKVDDLRKRIHSSPETIQQKLKSIKDMRYNVSQCYVPLLKLPVSGYVMEGVTLVLVEVNDPSYDNDNLMKSDTDDDFEDKEEAAYIEAMTEILKKHGGHMVTVIYNIPI